MADSRPQPREARDAQQIAQETRMFDEYMITLFRALGVQGEPERILRQLLQDFRPDERIRIIAGTRDFVLALTEADNALQGFLGSFGVRYNINKEAWDRMTSSLGELQMLSLLEKVEGTCDEVINALLNVLSAKITQVNKILKSKLPQPVAQGGGARAGGGNINDKYLNKYLKYKNKYVYLKRNY